MQSKQRAALLIAVLCLTPACDSGSFEIQPVLVQDTVLVAAPLPQNAALPTALDITGSGFSGVRGGRFPERSRDAEQWDFAVRIQGGELVLVPASVIGLFQSTAALTAPIEGETFESLRETPGRSSFRSDTTIAMRVGEVYAARSRENIAGINTACAQHAKFEPLEVDVSTGMLRIQIVTNQRCGDARLVPLE
ncbi:MAG: hypothetical protein WD766_14190 [Gemmatimonadota bacterium]